MNFKKFIPLSFTALSVMGAFTACSDDKVVGADEQANTMAERSSSSVIPGSSSSHNGLKKETVEFLSRIKKHNPNISVAFVSDGSSVVEDSVNAHATFNAYVDSILSKNSYKIDGEQLNESDDVYEFSSGGLYNENGKVYGPVSLHHVFSLKRVDCGYSRELVFSLEDGIHKIYAASETYETHIDTYSMKLDRELLVYDSSLVQQFKEDCVADNGLFAHKPYRFMSISEDDSVLYEHRDSIYTCQTSISFAGDAAIYTDTFWKKYVSLIFDRCIFDLDSLDSLDYDYFGKAEDSDESEE
jgi:hypothetical protein